MRTRPIAIAAAALAVITARPALAFDSKCWVVGNSGKWGECEPGPDTAHKSWNNNHVDASGASTEHRLLFVVAAKKILPAALLADQNVNVFAASKMITANKQPYTSLAPVPFESAERIRKRTFQIADLAQLPDFAFSFWDWVNGMESCPIDGLSPTDPAECHSFKTHMGPANSNHFLPQAKSFYVYIHDLALARAKACADMATKLGAPGGRFDDHVRECEVEALSLESYGQHFLQDAWSSGHMWERWGSPDIGDQKPFDFPFPVQLDEITQKRFRAMAVAAVSGLIHGSKALLGEDDAMCAPFDGVSYRGNDGKPHAAAGDLFLQSILSSDASSPYLAQQDQLLKCSMAGVQDVYMTTAHVSGDPLGGGMSMVDPESEDCFRQRMTNGAMGMGFGIDFFIIDGNPALALLAPLALTRVVWKLEKDPLRGWHFFLPMESIAGITLPLLLAAQFAVVELPLDLPNFALELLWVSVNARLESIQSPSNTTLAEGGIGSFFGADVNSAYARKRPLAAYNDPVLPWPRPKADTGIDPDRARLIASMWSRAHAAEWCTDVDPGTLSALKAHAGDANLDSDAQIAACTACKEIAGRHLRIGQANDYDKARLPLCEVLTDGKAVVDYAPSATSSDDPSSVAAAFCACASDGKGRDGGMPSADMAMPGDGGTCTTPTAADLEAMMVKVTGIQGEFDNSTITLTGVKSIGAPKQYTGSFGGPEAGNPMLLSMDVPANATVYTFGDNNQSAGVVGFPPLFGGKNFANRNGRSNLIAIWQDNNKAWQWAFNISGDSYNQNGGFPQWHEYQFVYDSRKPAGMRTRYDIFLGNAGMAGAWGFIRTAPVTMAFVAQKPPCQLPGM